MKRFAALLFLFTLFAVGPAYAAQTYTVVNSNCGLLSTLSVPKQIACMRAMEWPTAYYACSDTGSGTAECNPAFGSTSVPKVRVNTCNSSFDVFNVPGYGTFTAGYKCVSGLSNPPGYSWSGGSQSRDVWKGTVPTNAPLNVYKDGGGTLKAYGYPGLSSPTQFYTTF